MPLSQQHKARTRERIGYAGLIIVGIITILAIRSDVIRFFC